MGKARAGWGKFGFFENNFSYEKDFSVNLRHQNGRKAMLNNKMKTKKLNLKTIALSMAMAVMLLPLTANAQHDENQFGLREWGTINAQYDGNKFGLQEWGQTSLLGREGGGQPRRRNWN